MHPQGLGVLPLELVAVGHVLLVIVLGKVQGRSQHQGGQGDAGEVGRVRQALTPRTKHSKVRDLRHSNMIL